MAKRVSPLVRRPDRPEDLAVKRLGLEDPLEALDPCVVLGRASSTEGAVAGEPDAMAASRYILMRTTRSGISKSFIEGRTVHLSAT